MDRAKLQQHFRKFDGFKRISFHQDYVFVCFHQLEQAAAAIDRIHAEGGMLAAYAKHGVASGTQPSIVVPPNPILYVSVFPYFGEGELTTIFQQYEGFDSIEAAKRGLEDLNATTNPALALIGSPHPI
ncbi:hypothetical protein DFJ73DRAFT_780532 [Zopfochytrium polystomum]|nr:hypothetical protein DFJ73DRAFT_780532 [Zopfochytrium polystomum]